MPFEVTHIVLLIYIGEECRFEKGTGRESRVLLNSSQRKSREFRGVLTMENGCQSIQLIGTVSRVHVDYEESRSRGSTRASTAKELVLA